MSEIYEATQNPAGPGTEGVTRAGMVLTENHSGFKEALDIAAAKLTASRIVEMIFNPNPGDVRPLENGIPTVISQS